MTALLILIRLLQGWFWLTSKREKKKNFRVSGESGDTIALCTRSVSDVCPIPQADAFLPSWSAAIFF